jgi:hypothetical protein
MEVMVVKQTHFISAEGGAGILGHARVPMKFTYGDI